MKKTRKILAIVCALSLTAALAVGGTLAYLADKTEAVVNTFTVGNVDINLAETTGAEYKMIPGSTIAKDPKVTVAAGSEECWLFVQVVESENLDQFISYTVDTGAWTALTGVAGAEGVYYRVANAGEEFNVLTGNQVTVLDTVSNDMMNDLTKETYPNLTFTAYAVQKANINTAAEAWAQAIDPENY